MIFFLLSVGAVDALAPILVIIVLIGAAAGMTRGFSFLDLFGVSTFMGIMQRRGSASLSQQTRSKDIISAKSPFGKGNMQPILGGGAAATQAAAQRGTPAAANIGNVKAAGATNAATKNPLKPTPWEKKTFGKTATVLGPVTRPVRNFFTPNVAIRKGVGSAVTGTISASKTTARLVTNPKLASRVVGRKKYQYKKAVRSSAPYRYLTATKDQKESLQRRFLVNNQKQFNELVKSGKVKPYKVKPLTIPKLKLFKSKPKKTP